MQGVIPLLRLHGTPNCRSKSLKGKVVALLAKFGTTTLSKQGAASQVCPCHYTRMHCVRVARFVKPIGLFCCIRVLYDKEAGLPATTRTSTSSIVPPTSPRSATVNACSVFRSWAIPAIPKQTTKIGRQNRPSKQAAKAGHQNRPSKQAATTSRQNRPSKQATKTGRQNRPPQQAAKTGRQSRPPKQAAKTGRQNKPPKQAAKTGHHVTIGDDMRPGQFLQRVTTLAGDAFHTSIEPPKQATKTCRQNRPPKQAAKTGRQNRPPKQAPKRGHQNRLSKRATKTGHQNRPLSSPPRGA